jgi:hypothetical protein
LSRDGNFKGRNVHILEESTVVGGSLDACGSPEEGYVMRGGRMIEGKYLCTFDLFSSIPTLDGTQSVTQEMFKWNETMKTASRSRLVRMGEAGDSPEFGLSEDYIRMIERLELEPEVLLGRASIADQLDPSFFKTDFWFMWCTTFAFGVVPWSSSVISFASLIWSRDSTSSAASCARFITSMIRWFALCGSSWTIAGFDSASTRGSPTSRSAMHMTAEQLSASSTNRRVSPRKFKSTNGTSWS